MSMFVDKSIAQERYDICKKCDKFKNTFKICSVCVCFMPAKVTLSRASCPIGNWTDSVPSAEIVKSYHPVEQEISIKILKNITIVSKNEPQVRMDGSILREGDLWIKDLESLEIPELYRFSKKKWIKVLNG